MPWARTRAHHNRAEIVLNEKTFKAKTIKHSPGSLNTASAHNKRFSSKSYQLVDPPQSSAAQPAAPASAGYSAPPAAART